MWVVIVFMTGDVAAVPLSWILRMNDKVKCFWPLINPRNKVKKNVKPPEQADEYWELHECRLLFNEATFKTYKLAVQKEIDGQKHSNLESQEESDLERAKKRKHPKTKFSCESDESSPEPPKYSKLSAERAEQSAKNPKQFNKRAKLSSKCIKEKAVSSNESSDDNEYVFIKNVHNNLLTSTKRANKLSTSASSSISENAEAQTNEMATKSPVDVESVPEGAVPVIFEKTADIQTNEKAASTSVGVELMGEEVIGVTFEDDPEIQANEGRSVDVEFIPQQVESINTGPILLETIDFSEGVTGTTFQKICEVLQNQNDFKKVLVDITYKLKR